MNLVYGVRQLKQRVGNLGDVCGGI